VRPAGAAIRTGWVQAWRVIDASRELDARSRYPIEPTVWREVGAAGPDRRRKLADLRWHAT